MTIPISEIPGNVLSVTRLLGIYTISADTPQSLELGLKPGDPVPVDAVVPGTLLWVESAVLQGQPMSGNEVRQLRSLMDLTPEGFDDYVGLAPGTTAKWEQGKDSSTRNHFEQNLPGDTSPYLK